MITEPELWVDPATGHIFKGVTGSLIESDYLGSIGPGDALLFAGQLLTYAATALSKTVAERSGDDD